MDDSLQAALSAAQVLEGLGIRWFLGGSLASSFHGIPRATFDADIMADVRPSHVKALIESLGDDWYADEGAIREALAARSSFNLIHLPTAMKVDVFVPKLRRFDGGEFGRSLRVQIEEGSGREASVCCAEDIVIAKLEWYCHGDRQSEKQWADVIGVLRLNGDKLDRDLLDESAHEVGVTDLLNRALGEAGLDPFRDAAP